jgi:hypothetical protein
MLRRPPSPKRGEGRPVVVVGPGGSNRLIARRRGRNRYDYKRFTVQVNCTLVLLEDDNRDGVH